MHARFAALAVPKDENAAVEPREPLRDRETEPRIRRAGERDPPPPRREGLGVSSFLRQARPVVADGEFRQRRPNCLNRKTIFPPSPVRPGPDRR